MTIQGKSENSQFAKIFSKLTNKSLRKKKNDIFLDILIPIAKRICWEVVLSCKILVQRLSQTKHVSKFEYNRDVDDEERLIDSSVLENFDDEEDI